MALWLGVDVGGERKGFDVAVIDERSLIELRGGMSMGSVVELAVAQAPVLVAVDGPRACAPDGHTARADERELRRRVCGIRWTPDARPRADGRLLRLGAPRPGPVRSAGGTRRGCDRGVPDGVVDPVARPAGSSSRARWSRDGLAGLRLAGMPERTNQDERDAVAAAVTAREHTLGLTEAIGEIIVPAVRAIEDA